MDVVVGDRNTGKSTWLAKWAAEGELLEPHSPVQSRIIVVPSQFRRDFLVKVLHQLDVSPIKADRTVFTAHDCRHRLRGIDRDRVEVAVDDLNHFLPGLLGAGLYPSVVSIDAVNTYALPDSELAGRLETCDTCNGSGSLRSRFSGDETLCGVCEGEGSIPVVATRKST